MGRVIEQYERLNVKKFYIGGDKVADSSDLSVAID